MPDDKMSNELVERVVYRFRDTLTDLPYTRDIHDILVERHPARFGQLARDFPGIRIEPLFLSTPFETLQSLEHNSPGSRLTAFYQVLVPHAETAGAISQRLRTWEDLIELVYIAHDSSLANGGENATSVSNTMLGSRIPPGGILDPQMDNQDYLKAAVDGGVDTLFAWNCPGGDGEDTIFADVEVGWDLGHEDLRDQPICLMGGVTTGVIDRDHGTNVLGVVAARKNDKGIRGIAYALRLVRLSSQNRRRERVGGLWRLIRSYEDAIAEAGATPFSSCLESQGNLPASGGTHIPDVLAIPLEVRQRTGKHNRYPLEYEPAVFSIIQALTASGVIIVKAAGNGDDDDNGIDLDNVTDSAGNHVFDPNFRDSGAVVVGAVRNDANHTRLTRSNFGARVDCYASGENVFTTAPGNAYNAGFGNTSSACAIVAGVALSVVGRAKNVGKAISPTDFRDALRTTGTACIGTGGKRMPDLRKLFTELEIDGCGEP